MVTTEPASVDPGSVDVVVPDESSRRRSAREFIDAHPALIVFVCTFAILATLLLWKNHELFSVDVHENGDSAANAILIEKAKHLDLLVGNYSRQQFSHPGPADFYVEGAGEGLFHDALGIVPTPYNGQAVALLLLNAALFATALMIISAHSRSKLAIAACLGLIVAFGATHSQLISSTWMPYVYFAPFLLLIVAAASVATGAWRHLWCLALAGGLLVHGHVSFFLFVPLMALAALLALLYEDRARWRDAITEHRRDWILFFGVIGLFLLPMALNVLLHWPGEYGKYWAYSRSNKAGGHSLHGVLSYVAWYWPNDPTTRHLFIAAALLAAIALAVRGGDLTQRRFQRSLLLFGGLATVLFLVYALRGIDNLTERYIGYFSWSIPLVVMFVVAIGVCSYIERSSRILAWASLAVVALVIGLSLRNAALENLYRGDAGVPAATAELAAASAAHQPLVLDIDSSSWPDAVAVLLQADRDGHRACMRDPAWSFLVTPGFVCSAREVRDGAHFRFQPPGTATAPIVAKLSLSDITAG